ncbi:hypothetical protein TRFO_27592 [Tritrichomonas foetus]|uniref:PAS domain-containing protein n=1 Tax=Tritrichomonas foetus TaxID=1144522 RepID=A0A1J4K255_9EUKA|nr:hypothetical protein TRFO_27592 [Tritrichomonas foetus]|eukprot:OHT04864.1 hypothetical protein TRFO_27592 [Tritrichomonas foetus]
MRVQNLGISNSVTSLGLGSDDRSLDSSRKFPIFFSLILLIQSESQPPRIFRVFSTVWPVLQNIFLSLWPHVLHESTHYEEILTNVLFFATLGDDRTEIYSFVAVVILLSLITIVMLIIIVTIYFRKRVAIIPFLYMFNFFMHIVNPILIIPLGFLTGQLIVRVFYEPTPIFITLTVFCAIVLLSNIAISLCSYIFDASSLYLADSHFMTFDGIFQSSVMIIPSLVSLFSYVSTLFHPDFPYVVIAIHILYCIIFTIWLFWLPSGQPNVNPSFASFLSGMLISDIICVTSLHETWYRYIIALASILIMMFIMRFAFKERVKRILNPNLFNPDAEKPAPFDELNVKYSLFILRVALMHNHPIFTNGQLVENISKNARTDSERIALSRYICYFPDYQPIFIAQLAVLRRAHSLSLTNDFLLFQLRRLEVGFQKLAKIEEMNSICIESSSIALRLRSIWQQIELKNQNSLFETFDWLSNSIMMCHRKWEELITQYPHNAILAEEYSRFLIECKGDFSAAAEWHTMAMQIQEGNVFKYNQTTIHLLRAYPSYAKLILPKHKIMNIDDIDIQTKHEALGKFVDNADLHIEFQRATNGSYPISINVFLFISILSFLFIAVFWISFIIISFNRFDQFVDNMNIIHNTALLTQQVSTTGIASMFSIAEIFNIMPTLEEQIDVYGNDRIASNNTLMNMSGNFRKTIAHETELGMIYLNNLHNSILQQISKGNYLQVVLDEFFNNTLPSVYYLSKNETVTTSNNLQSALIGFFTRFTTISWRTDNNFVEETDVYTAANCGTQILDQIEIISSAFLKNDQYLFDLEFKQLFKVMIAIFVLYTVICIISPWIVFCLIKRNFSIICQKLSIFPKEVMDKGTQSIITKPSRENASDFVNVEPYFRYTSQLLMFISTFLGIILLSGLIEVQFRGDKIRNKFQTHSRLVHMTSMRACGSTEILYGIMSARIFPQLIPQVKPKYEQRLVQTIEKFVNTHEECGKLSYEDIGSNSDQIDKIRYSTKCPDWPDKTFHELLVCMGLDSAVSAYIEIAQTLQKRVHDEFLFKSERFINFMHFELNHLYYDMIMIPRLLIESAQAESSNFNTYLFLIGVISIIISFLQLLFNVTSFKHFIANFKLLLAFISRIPPQDLVNNNELLNLLLNIGQNKRDDLSDAALLVQDSSFPVVFIDRSATIEGVNNSFSILFGYESNYIVCQPISIIIEDESCLGFIELLKFGSHETVVKEMECKKENGTTTTFSISFIPIYDSSNLIHHIAMVFTDQTSIKMLQNRSRVMKESNENLIKAMYPPIIKQSLNGNFRMCAICMIKLHNIGTELLPARLLNQRQDIFNQFLEMLQIYSLLTPLTQKNGVFSVIGSGSNDPTELAIECLNFAFTVVDYFMTTASYGNFSAVVETNAEIKINWTDEDTRRIIVTGPLLKRANEILEISQAGKVCISEETYEFVMQHDLNFIPKTCNGKKMYIVEFNGQENEDILPENGNTPLFTGKEPQKNHSGITPAYSHSKITMKTLISGNSNLIDSPNQGKSPVT